MENKNLFWHGFKANVKKAFAELFILVGAILLFAGLMFEFYFIILGVCSIVFGLVLLFKGHSQRFDYQRKSGYIIHAGDS